MGRARLSPRHSRTGSSPINTNNNNYKPQISGQTAQMAPLQHAGSTWVVHPRLCICEHAGGGGKGSAAEGRTWSNSHIPSFPIMAYGEAGVAHFWQPASSMPVDKELKNSSTCLHGHGETYEEILTLLALCRETFPAEAARALEAIKAHRPLWLLC